MLKTIKNTKTGDPAYTTSLMIMDCGSSPKWAEKVKKSYNERISKNKPLTNLLRLLCRQITVKDIL